MKITSIQLVFGWPTFAAFVRRLGVLGLSVAMRRDETKGQTIEWRRRTEEFGSYTPLPDFCRHHGFNPIRTHLIGTVRANFGAD